MLDIIDNAAGNVDKKSLGDIVAEIFVEQLRYEDYERTPKMRGADLAHECVRVNTLRLHQTFSDGLSGYSTVAAESGKAVESLLQRNLLKNNPDSVLLWDEFIPKLKKMGLNFSGKLDFLLDIPDYGMVVVDIKTTQRINPEKRVTLDDIERLYSDNDYPEFLAALKKTKGGLRGSTLKMPRYVWQVTGYATFLDITHGCIMVISRSKESFREPVTTTFELIEVTDEMKYDTICKMLMAQRLADQYAVPAKPEQFKKTVHCQYCDFWNFCWKNEGTESFKHLTTEETETLYTEIYPEAVELYEKFRKELAWIRDMKIKEAQAVKDAIQGDEKAIKEIFQTKQLNLDEYLFESFDAYPIADAKQFSIKANFFCRDCQ